MPELPDIVVLARSMDQALRGKTFSDVAVNQQKCVNLPVDEYRSAIVGATVTGARQRGKLVILELDNGWVLWFSLGMGGEVRLHGPEELPDPKRERLVYRFSDGEQLWAHFWWFGNAHAVRADELDADPRVGSMGPEPLADDFTVERLAEVLRGRRVRIKDLLLNQKVIAGIGNVYVQDILWYARLHPAVRAESLSREDIERLHGAIRRILNEGISWGGGPGEQDVWGNKGKYHEHLQVGYRTGKPCPECGTIVQERRVGGTMSYFCPRCQPGRL